MRKLICIFLLTALLLSTLAACNASDKTPDGTPDAAPDNVGNDTSADTTAALPETTTAQPEPTEPVSTDTADTTAPIIYHGSISCADNIDLSDIKVDIYRIESPSVMVMPDPRYTQPVNYTPHIDHSEYSDKYIYLFSVYTDKDGNFSFELPEQKMGRLMFDYSTFPKQYGIREVSDPLAYDGENYGIGFSYNENNPEFSVLKAEFALEKVTNARLEFVWAKQSFGFEAYLTGGNNIRLYADYQIQNGRFDDSFIQDMVSGDKTNYTATVVCGDLSETASCEVWWKSKYNYWEWRVQYLYYNNYITKEQYDNIVATTPPSEILPNW